MYQRLHYDIRLPSVRYNHQQASIAAVCANLFGTLPPDVVEVIDISPLGWKRAVRQHAVFFRREFEYDFTQYDPADEDPDCRAFVWTEPEALRDDRYIALGSACFRKRWLDEDADDGEWWWAMQWVWLHPFVRRDGLLSGTWGYFRNRFGQFKLEQPLSQAMDAFAAKTKHYEITATALDHDCVWRDLCAAGVRGA